MADDGAKIRITGLKLRFADHQVLNGVDLTLTAGRNTVLIGSAASGKTVLLKCITGLHKPDAGQIVIDGQDTTALKGQARVDAMENIGVLFQRNALFDSLTVWENVAFRLLNLHHVAPAKARVRAVDKLALVGLGADVADLFPVDISGGMQKRVGLARAIISDPDILILDDPTAGLDPIMTTVINRLINDIVSDLGATALCVTGDMDSARREFDELAMLNDGRIIWHGATDAIDAADNPYLDQLIHGRAKGPIEMQLQEA